MGRISRLKCTWSLDDLGSRRGPRTSTPTVSSTMIRSPADFQPEDMILPSIKRQLYCQFLKNDAVICSPPAEDSPECFPLAIAPSCEYVSFNLAFARKCERLRAVLGSHGDDQRNNRNPHGLGGTWRPSFRREAVYCALSGTAPIGKTPTRT